MTSPCRLPGLEYKIATEFLLQEISDPTRVAPTVRKRQVSRVHQCDADVVGSNF